MGMEQRERSGEGKRRAIRSRERFCGFCFHGKDQIPHIAAGEETQAMGQSLTHSCIFSVGGVTANLPTPYPTREFVLDPPGKGNECIPYGTGTHSRRV